MRIVMLAFLLNCTIYHIGAQGTTPGKGSAILQHLESVEAGKGVIDIQQDSQIKTFLEKYLEVSRHSGVQGFRIRIFSDSSPNSKNKATEVKKNFMELYPDYSSYILYDSPNFKIYIGDFRNRSEAIKALQAVSKKYNSAFIVNDIINTTE